MIINIYFVLKSLEPFENSEFLKESKITAADNNEINRFHANDIDFFDLFYNKKTIDIVFIIKHFNKNIYFRDIYIFIDRIKDVIRVKDNVLLR